jgi:hypothetical protein
LELIFQLYRARKEFTGNSTKQALLEQASQLLSNLEVDEARSIIDSVLTPGDFNGDGNVDGRDFLVWQRQVGQTGYYPLQQKDADTNADGIVDSADLALWHDYYGYAKRSNRWPCHPRTGKPDISFAWYDSLEPNPLTESPMSDFSVNERSILRLIRYIALYTAEAMRPPRMGPMTGIQA